MKTDYCVSIDGDNVVGDEVAIRRVLLETELLEARARVEQTKAQTALLVAQAKDYVRERWDAAQQEKLNAEIALLLAQAKKLETNDPQFISASPGTPLEMF